MNQNADLETKSTAAMYLTVGAFAFVVGSLVTLQFATLSQTAGLTSTAAFDPVFVDEQGEDVTRQAGKELLVLGAQEPVLSDTNAELNVGDGAVETATIVDLNAEKQRKIKEANDIVLANNMRMLTEGVVAGLYDFQADSGPDGQPGRIVLNSRNAGSTAAKIELMLQKAAISGDIAVPEELALEGGNIDSSTLLFQLVQDALEAGDAEAVEAARDMRRRAFASSAASTQEVGGERYYIVESGDSLAYISLQFYGKTNLYQKIFAANGDILSSPDKIRIGQRLRIPS